MNGPPSKPNQGVIHTQNVNPIRSGKPCLLIYNGFGGGGGGACSPVQSLCAEGRFFSPTKRGFAGCRVVGSVNLLIVNWVWSTG